MERQFYYLKKLDRRRIQKTDYFGSAEPDTLWRKDQDRFVPLTSEELKDMVFRQRIDKQASKPRQPWK